MTRLSVALLLLLSPAVFGVKSPPRLRKTLQIQEEGATNNSLQHDDERHLEGDDGGEARKGKGGKGGKGKSNKSNISGVGATQVSNAFAPEPDYVSPNGATLTVNVRPAPGAPAPAPGTVSSAMGAPQPVPSTGGANGATATITSITTPGATSTAGTPANSPGNPNSIQIAGNSGATVVVSTSPDSLPGVSVVTTGAASAPGPPPAPGSPVSNDGTLIIGDGGTIPGTDATISGGPNGNEVMNEPNGETVTILTSPGSLPGVAISRGNPDAEP